MDKNNISEALTQVEETVIAETEKTMPVKISKDEMKTSVKEEIVTSHTQKKMDTMDKSVIFKKEEIVPNKDVEFETVIKDKILVEEIIDNNVKGNTTETTPTEVDHTVQIEALEINMTEKPMNEEVMGKNKDILTNLEEIMAAEMNDSHITNGKNPVQEEIKDPELTQKSFLMFAYFVIYSFFLTVF